MSSAVKTIAETCEFVFDGTHGSPERTVSGVPVLSAQNINYGKLSYETDRFTSEVEYEKYSKKFKLKNGDVLLTIVGSIGRSAVVENVQPLVFQRSVAILRPICNLLDPRFLFHLTQSSNFKKQLARHTNKSSQAGVYLGRLKEISFELPPLAEQQRIAAILDKAEEIKRKREQAIAKLDELAQSTFVEMFGGIIKTRELGEICDVRDGTHDSPKYTNSGYPLITSKNLTGGAINFQEANLISEEDYLAICKRSKVDCGDILMPMIGTIGNPVIVLDKTPKFAIKNVALIKFDKDSPSAKYINALLKSEVFKKYVSKKSRGGTQKFLSLGDIRKLPVPIPSKELELEFEKKIELKEKLLLSQYASMSHTEQLLSALQHQAFTIGFRA